jgi:hypothetical protein
MGQKMPEGEDPPSGGEVDTAAFTALLQQVTNVKSQIRIPAHFFPVLRIRILMFLGLLDPDPLVRGMDPDPDPSIIKQT